MMDRLIPSLFLIPLIGVVAILFSRLFRNATQEEEAKSCPITEATIQSAGIESVGSGRYKVDLPCFAFSYVVGGEYFSGRFSLAVHGERATALTRALIDTKLNISYAPGRPSSYRIADAWFKAARLAQHPIKIFVYARHEGLRRTNP